MSPVARSGVARLGQVGYVVKGLALGVVGGLHSYRQSRGSGATSLVIRVEAAGSPRAP